MQACPDEGNCSVMLFGLKKNKLSPIATTLSDDELGVLRAPEI